MVLTRILPLLALFGCKQSLFANGGGGNIMDDQPDGGVPIPATCPATCLGNAGGDFGSTTHPWRYVEDNRKHGWAPMPVSGGTATGADSANTITSCATDSSAAACNALPGGLVVSTSGANAAADPAIELTIKANAVIKIDLAAVLASGDSQAIRLYRNSREDVLFTGTLDANSTVTTSLTLDALAGDRILVAVAPSAMGATGIGLQVFVSDTGAKFPSDCQLALEFAPITGTEVVNACSAMLTSQHYDDTNDDNVDLPLKEMPSVFPELGYAGQLNAGDLYDGLAVMDRTGDTTTQLWIQQTSFVDEAAWFFSDMDLDSGGGVGIDLGQDDSGNPVIETFTGTVGAVAGITAALSDPTGWHFARTVYSQGTMTFCVDGKKVGTMAMPSLKTAYPVWLGKDHDWTPVGGFAVGLVDDVRVIKGALPCD